MGPAGPGEGPRVVTIDFPSGNQAQAVLAGPRRTAEALLGGLGLTGSRPVLLVVGGAGTMDPDAEPRLQRLLERGAIRAAADVGASILDGGTTSGVMAALGRAVAASDVSVPLVGVAPGGKVTFPGDDRGLPDASTKLEPNHSHFLLANSSEWGGETTLMFDVLDELAEGQPAAVLVAGGGPVALDELTATVERGIPIVVITETGGIADSLAERARSTTRKAARDAIDQIADEGHLTFVPLAADPPDLGRVLGRFLRIDETLADAWRQQQLVSSAARRQQRDFRIGQSTLLVLGLAVTMLVIAKAVVGDTWLRANVPLVDTLLSFVIVLVPITIATLAAAATKMRPGSRWVLLRGTSEAIKREIFRYRARAGIYSHEQTRTTPREVKLAQAVGSAMGALMRTDVNLLALDHRPAAKQEPKSKVAGEAVDEPQPQADNPMSRLTPAGYIKHRVDAQIDWYRRKAAQLEREARWLRWLALGFGALGTLLAAIGFEIWVAVTTSLVGVYTTIVEAWQLETSVTLYNQAATDLNAIRAWWVALPPTQQDLQATTDRLVDRSERIMRAEHTGWVQEMQDAMTQLRLEQAPGEGRSAPSKKDSAEA